MEVKDVIAQAIKITLICIFILNNFERVIAGTCFHDKN